MFVDFIHIEALYIQWKAHFQLRPQKKWVFPVNTIWNFLLFPQLEWYVDHNRDKKEKPEKRKHNCTVIIQRGRDWCKNGVPLTFCID